MSNPEKSASKMWSGRFREPLNATFESWQRSFPFDWCLLPTRSKPASPTPAPSKPLASSPAKNSCRWSKDSAPSQKLKNIADNEQAEDIHHFVELELTKHIGDLALKLHTGRSRNEQIATDMRLFVREAIDNTIEGLRQWAHALITLAESAGEAVMPSYTHLQRAEPVLVAHWLLTYVSMIERDITRLTDARKRMNLCPLGSGSHCGCDPRPRSNYRRPRSQLRWPHAQLHGRDKRP